MKYLALSLGLLLSLAGCSSNQVEVDVPPPGSLDLSREYGLPPQYKATPAPMGVQQFTIAELQSRLGLNRDPQELGFEERNFDGCRMSVKGQSETCGWRYLSVVNFRLVCRDTIETTTRVPASLTPLSGKQMSWRLAGLQGTTQTDSLGYGQVRLVSNRSTKSERFMLVIGTRSLGVEAGEVSQIVIPGNWCHK